MRMMTNARYMLALGVMATMVLVACGSESPTAPSPQSYSVVGAWSFVETYPPSNPGAPLRYVFSGTSAGGTVNVENGRWTGNYAASAAEVTITLGSDWLLVGTFQDANTLRGTVSFDGAKRGTFVGTRP